MSLSWDEKWTWNHPDFYILFVSFERFDGMQLLAAQVGGVAWWGWGGRAAGRGPRKLL